MRTMQSVVAVLLLVSWSGSGVLGQPTPVGSDFQVNVYTSGRQYQASAAVDVDGDFIVTWSSFAQDGSSWGVFGRRFDSSGLAQAAEFQVNTYSTGQQYRPTVAMDTDGDFVIAWSSYGEDGLGFGIFAQRFDSAGTAQGPEIQVNSHTPFAQNFPAVAIDGDFVVTWQSYRDGSGVGIFAQRFDSAGVLQGGEFQVNSYTSDYQAYSSVAMDDAGRFVVAWSSVLQDGNAEGVFAQRFDASGTALGAELQVNAFTDSAQSVPSAAMDDDGDFVIAWSSALQDGSGTGVFARRFASGGAALGGELQVNSHTQLGQSIPSAAMDGDGDFVVVWNGYYQDGGPPRGVFGRFFDSSGAAGGGEIQVNAYTMFDQAFPTAAMDADGDFVVAWASYAQDGNDRGVFARRFAPRGGGPIVTIDIAPGVFPNRINLRSNGLVRVAILTTSVADGDPADFDAWDVDPSTVVFGPLGATPHSHAQAEDVDGDGDLDMVLRFRIPTTGIACGATEATLRGETFAGEAFAATDSVLTKC